MKGYEVRGGDVGRVRVRIVSKAGPASSKVAATEASFALYQVKTIGVDFWRRRVNALLSTRGRRVERTKREPSKRASRRLQFSLHSRDWAAGSAIRVAGQFCSSSAASSPRVGGTRMRARLLEECSRGRGDWALSIPLHFVYVLRGVGAIWRFRPGRVSLTTVVVVVVVGYSIAYERMYLLCRLWTTFWNRSSGVYA